MKTRFRTLKRIALALGSLALLPALALVLFKTWVDSRAFAGYEPSLTRDPAVLEVRELAGGRAELTEIAGVGDERFPFKILLPETAEPPYPCVVLLYGIGQRMEFFEEIAPLFAQRGIALVVPEQYGRGVRRGKKGGTLAEARRFHTRCSRIVPETRCLVDHLLERGDIDPTRLDLLGASYGGILGCAVMRHEPRFRSAVLSLAGGDLPALVRNTAELGELGRSAAPLAAFAAWWLEPYEPLRHVGGVAPRPLLFINLEKDELIPRPCTEALYAAAREPKEIEWMEASHLDIDETLVVGLVSRSLAWIEARGRAGE